MKDAMAPRKPSPLFTCFLFHLFLLFPTTIIAVSDSDAARASLDSIFAGDVTVSWIDQSRRNDEKCRTNQFGPIGNSILRFGPTHDGKTDRNPYFISLDATDNDTISLSMQSSAASKGLKTAWWDVKAHLEERTGYTVTGNLTNTKDIDKDDGNVFDGKIECDAAKQDFNWNFLEGQTNYSGFINPVSANLIISGRNSQKMVSYTIKFTGGWVPTSAKLNIEAENPTWPKPRDLPPSKTNTPPEVTKTIEINSPLTLLLISGTFTLGGPGGMPTVISDGTLVTPPNLPGPKGGGGKMGGPPPSPLGRGGVAAITVTCVAAVGIIGALAFWCCARGSKRKQDSKVYPELAYLYTPSPSPYNKVPHEEDNNHNHNHNEETGAGAGAGEAEGNSSPPPPPPLQPRQPSSSLVAGPPYSYHHRVPSSLSLAGPVYHHRAPSRELEMREVLVQDTTLPVTDQHQWRVF